MPSCSQEAIAATRRLALPVGRAIRVSIVGGDENGTVEARINEDVGGIVSAAVRYERECQPPPGHAPHRLFVIPSKCMGPIVLPAGTRLHGAARTTEGRVQIRFERAILPDGRTQPFCGVVVWDVDQRPGIPVNYPSYLNDLGIADRSSLPPVIADDGRIRVQIVDALPATTR